MKSILLVLILCLVSCSIPTNGSNILYLSLTPSPSHNIWDKTLAMGLRARGHHITFVTHSPEKSIENFTTIVFEGMYDMLNNEYNFEEFSAFSYLRSITELFSMMLKITDNALTTNGFKQFMDLVNKKPKYDLIIMDTTNGQFIYPVFEILGNPPVIGTSPFGVQPYHTYTGYEINYGYIPIFILPFTNKMTFWQRAQNYFFTSIYVYYHQHVFMPKVWEKTEKFFGKNIKPYQEVQKQFSLVLANYDPVFDYPQSLPPTIIGVGGLHTRREKSLPKDLQKILDNAKHGIVLFSLGTNILSKDLGQGKRQALIDGLGKIKQTVLWKYEEEITGLPENIITRTWLPQNDILAHPNIKAFITHGGALSTQEAMLHGIPVITMPFFLDQFVNSRKIVNKKLGLLLDHEKLTADIVYETIRAVVNTEEYGMNMKLISKRYRDQKEDPLTRAIWWTEYAIRQGGAEFLVVASRDIPSFQLNMLDIWATAILSIFAIVYAFIKIICLVCCKSNSQNKRKLKKN